MAKNNLTFLIFILDYLKENGIESWIFGGWAKELHGMIPPRQHNDIDLLYPADNFDKIDNLIKKDKSLSEIKEKRKAYKRAFLKNGVMTELFLVKKDEVGCFSPELLAQEKFFWPSDVLNITVKLKNKNYHIASIAALDKYSY